MAIGCILILLGLTFNIPKPFNVMREIAVLPLGLYGFSLIVLGERKKKGLQTTREDELTERIATNLSKSLEQKVEQEESHIYS